MLKRVKSPLSNAFVHPLFCFGKLATDGTIIAVVGLHVRDDVTEYAFSNSIPVNKITVHAEFNPNTLENDIAILTLAKYVIMSSNVSVVCLLPEVKSYESNATVARVAGWGVNSLDSKKLQQTEMTVLDNGDLKCSRYLKDHLDSSKIYCALHVNNTHVSNVCLGDR